MREIKFRAWDTGSRSWLLKFYVDAKDGLVVTKQPSLTGLNKLIEIKYGSEAAKLMQYTGLKDKNGVEIYEGDIVRDTDGDSVHAVVYGVNEVSDYPAFCLSPSIDVEYNDLQGIVTNGICEVIGNIYENPELLEQS